MGIISCVFNGAGSMLRINKGTRATGNPGSATSTGWQIGPNALVIARLETYLSALSNTDQDTEVDFLASRYGISV